MIFRRYTIAQNVTAVGLLCESFRHCLAPLTGEFWTSQSLKGKSKTVPVRESRQLSQKGEGFTLVNSKRAYRCGSFAAIRVRPRKYTLTWIDIWETRTQCLLCTRNRSFHPRSSESGELSDCIRSFVRGGICLDRAKQV